MHGIELKCAKPKPLSGAPPNSKKNSSIKLNPEDKPISNADIESSGICIELNPVGGKKIQVVIHNDATLEMLAYLNDSNNRKMIEKILEKSTTFICTHKFEACGIPNKIFEIDIYGIKIDDDYIVAPYIAQFKEDEYCTYVNVQINYYQMLLEILSKYF